MLVTSSTIAMSGRPVAIGHLQSACGRVRRNRRLANKEWTQRYAEPGDQSGSGSGLLGPDLPPLVASDEQAASITTAMESVEINPESTVDYSTLIALLKAKDFQKADDEARSLLLQLAGKEAQSRGWIYFTEVSSIPDADMKTVDDLWKASSNGKFGYSVQKKIFKQCMRRWTKFFKAIDWTVGENNYYRKWPSEFIYSLDAKPGHLPATNCLRGTQLFEGLMHHKGLETEEITNPVTKKWTSL